MRAQNRHDTLKWKKRRKHKGGHKCNKPQCTICHCNKVLGVPTRQEMRVRNQIEIFTYNDEEWERAHEIAAERMFEP